MISRSPITAVVIVLVLAIAAIIVPILVVTNTRGAIAPLTPAKPIVMKLSRSGSACPNYSITLTGDGHLTYNGMGSTIVAGMHESDIDGWTTSAVINDFIQSGFFELENTYPSPGSDKMVVVITIEMNGASKTVYSEDRYGPLLIQEMERRMDDLPGMRALTGWIH